MRKENKNEKTSFVLVFIFIEKKKNITSNKHNDLYLIKRQKNLNSITEIRFLFY